MDLFINDDKIMYGIINGIKKSEIRTLLDEYNSRNKKERVVKARRLILEHLNNGEKVNSDVVNKICKRVQTEAEKKGYTKKIFLRWSNGRILFPLYYEKYDIFVKSFLTELAIEIRSKLDIVSETDFHVVTFMGPQNQGAANCWLALYNNSHKSQLTAQQLMFSLWPNLVNYGKYYHKTQSRKNLTTKEYPDVTISSILKVFNRFKNDILNNTSDKTKSSNKKKVKKGKAKNGRNGTYVINTSDIFRKGTEPTVITRKHSKIQKQLLEDLKNIYSKENVEAEVDFIDIKVENDDKIILFEIKAYENPIKCIKEAIGQLLLYSFNLNNPKNKKIELRVIGPNRLNKSIPKFREYIKENLNMDFDYLDLKLS